MVDPPAPASRPAGAQAGATKSGSVLLADARRQAREVLGLAGSLCLHAMAGLLIVLYARSHAPIVPPEMVVDLIFEGAALPVPTGPVSDPLPETVAAMPPPDKPVEPVAVEPAPAPRSKPPVPRLPAPSVAAPSVAPPASSPAAPAADARPPVPAPLATAPRAAPPPPNTSHRYGAVLLQWLERYREYPRAARLRRQEGSVLIRLTIDRGGRLLAADIASSSGIDALDNAALDTARRAAPMPPLPQDLPGDRVVMIVPVVFALSGG